MHLLQGLAVGTSKEEQFNPIAIILAIVVFPTPLIPVNTNACAIFLLSNAFSIVLTAKVLAYYIAYFFRSIFS